MGRRERSRAQMLVGRGVSGEQGTLDQALSIGSVQCERTFRHPSRDTELQLQTCFGVQRNGPHKNCTIRVTNVHMVLKPWSQRRLREPLRKKALSLEKNRGLKRWARCLMMVIYLGGGGPKYLQGHYLSLYFPKPFNISMLI